MERLITISHKMTLEHAEFPGDILSTLGMLYCQYSEKAALPSRKLSSLIKARQCYELAAQCYPEVMRTKKYAAQTGKEEVSDEIEKLRKPNDGLFRLKTKQIVDDYMRNARRNPLEGMLYLIDLRDMRSGSIPACEIAYIEMCLAEVDCLLLPGYKSNGLKLAQELQDSGWLTEEQREKMKNLINQKEG